MYILGADAATGGSSWVMLVLLGVVMVGMMLMSIIPQKKRQKKAKEMMESITVGTKIKTIGGFMGQIKAIDDAQQTFMLDISSKGDGSVCVTIDKSAVYTVVVASEGGQLVEKQKTMEVMAEDDRIAEEKAQNKKKEKMGKNVDKKVSLDDNSSENSNDLTI